MTPRLAITTIVAFAILMHACQVNSYGGYGRHQTDLGARDGRGRNPLAATRR